MSQSYNGWTAQQLIEFETEIESHFLNAEIRAPIHLSRGNEDALIKLFSQNDIGNKKNWLFSNHRSHYHALLKGIPPDWLKEQILLGRSMHINSRKYKFITSSIVNGGVPIATGLAYALKMKDSKDKVWCFVGDMAGSLGEFYNASKYAQYQNLPIYFVIECNNLSTNTPTDKAWGYKHEHHDAIDWFDWGNGGIGQYCYERGCAHINVAGKWVEFK